MKKVIPFLLAGIFFVVGLATIQDYGINWDTPQRLLRGQAYDYYFLTRNLRFPKDGSQRTSPLLFVPGEFVTRVNFLSGEQPTPAVLPERPLPFKEYEASGQLTRRESFFKHDAWDPQYYLYNEEPGHPPVPENAATIFNRILWGKLGLFGDLESYDVFFVLISALGILIIALFAMEITGSAIGSLVAGLSMVLYPIFFAESHFNLKDPLQASMFAGAVWALWHWVKSNQRKWCATFIGFVTLALGIKWNIGFLPFIAVPWLFLIRKESAFRTWFRWKKIIGIAGVSFIVISLFLVIIWPTAWVGPTKWLGYIPQFYFDNGTGTDHIQPSGFILPFGWNIFVLLSYLIQTPPVVLLLAAFGIMWSLRKDNNEHLRIGTLLVLWLCVTLVRTMVPGMRNYSGLRQIMEVIPVTALLAGVGASFVIEKTRGYWRVAVQCLITIAFIILLIILIRLHPNENLYFNLFTGGIPGAAKHNLIDTMVSYGNVYKQGADWLNKNASQNANIAVLEGYDLALSPLWLRPDISISPYHFSGLEKLGEYIIALRHHNNQPSFARLYAQTFLTPVYEVNIDGVAFLTIYKNDNAFVKKGYDRQEVEIKNVPIKTVPYPGGVFMDILLGVNRRITRISISGVFSPCADGNSFAILNETIAFVPKNANQELLQTNISDHLYSIQERKKLPNGDVEYYFPAQRASLIRITPKSNLSCFLGSKIASIYYLPE